MGLLGRRLERGGDRVEPRRQLAQQALELPGRQRAGEILEQIDDLPAFEVGAPAVAREQLLEGRRRVDLGQRLHDGSRERRDVELVGEPLGELGLALEPGRTQHRLDHRGVVLRHDAQRIAGLEGQAGARKRQLEMDRLLARAAAVQIDQLGDLGRERMRLAIRRRRRRAGKVEDHGAAPGVCARPSRFGSLGQLLERGLCPVGRRTLVVEIAVDPRRDAQAAKLGKPGIEPPADLAEVDVAGIAERQHAEADAIEARRVLGHQPLIELDRPLRRVALAPGAGDYQQVRHLGDLGGRGLRHVDQLCRKPLLGRRFFGLGGDSFRIAQLGPEQDRERDFRPRPRQWRGQRQCGRGMVSGEKAREPLALLEVGLGHHGVQSPDVLDRKRRALGQDGQGGAGH